MISMLCSSDSWPVMRSENSRIVICCTGRSCFKFLYYPGVPPTNNQSEQALRTSVIHRKVTNGFRSDWGAKAYTDLLSVIATSKIKGQRVIETLVDLMGHPVLQFLGASSP